MKKLLKKSKNVLQQNHKNGQANRLVVNNKSVKSGGYSCDTKHGNIGSDHEWELG